MVAIAIAPIVMKDVNLKVGADNYEQNVSTVTLDPSASVVTWKGLSPVAQFSDTSVATWTCTLGYAQDWATASALSRYLYDNEGATVVMDFYPKSGGQGWRANVIITPGAIGGAVDTVAVGSVSLGVSGKPVPIIAGSGVPILLAAAPNVGGIAGANLVQITGRGFTGTTSVLFGTVAATNFTVVNDSLIVATAPAQAVGSKPVKVTNASGASLTTPYTYA